MINKSDLNIMLKQQKNLLKNVNKLHSLVPSFKDFT